MSGSTVRICCPDLLLAGCLADPGQRRGPQAGGRAHPEQLSGGLEFGYRGLAVFAGQQVIREVFRDAGVQGADDPPGAAPTRG